MQIYDAAIQVPHPAADPFQHRFFANPAFQKRTSTQACCECVKLALFDFVEVTLDQTISGGNVSEPFDIHADGHSRNCDQCNAVGVAHVEM